MKKRSELISLESKFETAERYEPNTNEGLCSLQVDNRIKDGLVNKTISKTSKSTWQIIKENTFTFFNLLLLSIAIVLFIFGLFTQVTFMVAVIFNTLIGIVQELRSKHTLEKLQLTIEEKVVVIRDSKESEISISKLVLDDIYKLKAGDQIPVDSIVLDGFIESNESMITGESDAIKKNVGNSLYGGSFVISGSCIARVLKVSELNYIATIQAKAKEMNSQKANLVKSMDKVLKVLAFIIVPIGIALFLVWLINDLILSSGSIQYSIVQQNFSYAAGSMVNMVPAGMYLLISIALFKSVISLSKKNAMVQDIYSVERLARVDTLCLDKTGTLTDGSMMVKDVIMFDTNIEIDKLMSSYLSSFEDTNQTSLALIKKYKKERFFQVEKSLPFSSLRKYSMVKFSTLGVYALGAPEYLIKDNKEIENIIIEKQRLGLRAVIICKSDSDNFENIDSNFIPVALFILQDNIRKEAPDTIKWFYDNKVDIKIISGDNPLTVSQIAKECGVNNFDKYISLEGMSEEDVKNCISEYTIFGRVTPEQKAIIIKGLKAEGHTVAMTGDGVNDILAMKTSDCSVAMANGSQACRNSAHLVLLDSNFSSMPLAVSEGRKCINNVQQSSVLYLMKTVFAILFSLIIIATNIVNDAMGVAKMYYPFQPKNLIIMSTFCIGLSSLIIALRKDDKPIQGDFIKTTFIKAIPAGIYLVFCVGLCYIFRYSKNNILRFSTDSDIFNLQFTTLCSLSMVYGTLAMSFLCFQPIFPLSKYKSRAISFIIIFILTTFTVFIAPLIKLKDTNISQLLIGIDVYSLFENGSLCYILLVFYIVLSVPILIGLTKLSQLVSDKILSYKK